MKPLIIVAAIAAMLISCSKSNQDTSSADTTAIEVDTVGNGEPVNLGTPTTLTADEMERATAEIFLFVRRDVPAYQTAYIEDIVVTGDKFKYTFIKHNGDNSGMQGEAYSGTYMPTDEQIAEWQKDSTSEYPQGEPYTRNSLYFNPEMDTFYVEGKYIAYLESEPEAKPRRLTLKIVADIIHTNANNVDPDTQEVKFYKEVNEVGNCDCTNGEPFILIDFAEEHKFNKEDLYLKAKVMDLTEKDLASLNKDDLSYLRNDIFARHGHTFKTAKLIQRYSDSEWYQAVTPDASKVFNKYEKRNVDLLKKREG